MKRGVGRSAEANGNGHAVFPPGPISTVRRYQQPLPPARSGLGLLGRILLATLLFAMAGGKVGTRYHAKVDRAVGV